MLNLREGVRRFGVVVSIVTIAIVAFHFRDPYYIRHPEDALVGLWVIFWYWAVYFAAAWISRGFMRR